MGKWADEVLPGAVTLDQTSGLQSNGVRGGRGAGRWAYGHVGRWGRLVSG